MNLEQMGAPARSSVPLHHQIAQVLRSRLESGAWAASGAIATEQRLCEEFGASRTTVRQALSELKRVGLLESRAGVGTRTVAAPVKRVVVTASGDPLHASLDTKPRIVTIGEVPCPPAAASFLGVDAGARVWHFLRIHMLDDKPLSVVDSYFPAAIGKGLNRKALQQPMQELLWQRHRLRVDRSVHTIRVARADIEVASLLRIPLADPVLRIQSSAYLADGTPIRWTDNYFREDRYEYAVELQWPAADGKRVVDGNRKRRAPQEAA